MKLGHVLVTGGAGFIGSQLVSRLLPFAEKISIVDDLSTGVLEAIPNEHKVNFYQDSILNEELLASMMPEIDLVFHVACRNLVKSMDDIKADMKTNLLGALAVLEQAKENGTKLKRIVYTSTASIYGNARQFPTKEWEKQITAPYAASKFSAEQYFHVFHQMYRLPMSIVRLSNVYGPGQLVTNPYCGVVAKFFDAIDCLEPFIIHGEGEQTRDFTYIDDAVSAILLAATKEEAVGQVFNVGTGRETTVLQLGQMIAEAHGYEHYPVVHVPKRKVDTIQRRSLSIEFIKRTLNWVPQNTLEAGIQQTLNWLKEKNKS